MAFKIWNVVDKCWYTPTYEAYLGRLSELLLTHKGDLVEHTCKGLTHESLFAGKYKVVWATPWSDSEGNVIHNYDIVHIDTAHPYGSGKYTVLWDNKLGCWYLLKGKTRVRIHKLVENTKTTTIMGSVVGKTTLFLE